MQLRDDLDTVLKRWDRYWDGTGIGRPFIHCTVPKPGVDPVSMPHPYLAPRIPMTAFIDLVRTWASSRIWLADSVPNYRVSFAPDHFALLCGADLEYSGDVDPNTPVETPWVHPFLGDYDHEIKFLPEGAWWEKTVACIRELREALDDMLIVAGPDLQGGLDCLAALRGPEQLAMDLVLCPDEVKNALKSIDQAQHEIQRALDEVLDTAERGTITRHNMVSRHRIGLPQCDFSAMISPDMFKEFGLPSLISECNHYVGAEYHLDGPQALRHLPAVATVEKIQAIQWQPGAGEAATADWSALYRQIDDLGLGQVRYNPTREEVLEMASRYTSTRLYVDTVADIQTEEACHHFLQELEENKHKGARE